MIDGKFGTKGSGLICRYDGAGWCGRLMNVCVCLQTGMLMGPRSGGKFSITKQVYNTRQQV